MKNTNNIAVEANQKTQENSKPKGWLRMVKSNCKILHTYKLKDGTIDVLYEYMVNNVHSNGIVKRNMPKVGTAYYSLATYLGIIDMLDKQENTPINIAIKKLQQAGIQTNTRINHNGGYLFCRDINPADYCDIYDSWKECFKDLKDDIILDCKKLGYTKKETEAVLLHIKRKLLGL